MVRQLAGEPAKQAIRVRGGGSSCRHLDGLARATASTWFEQTAQLNCRTAQTPVIENSDPNFRKGSEAEIQTKTLPQSTG